MPDETCNVRAVLQEWRITEPPDEGIIVSVYQDVAKQPAWHLVVCQLLRNDGIVSWTLLDKVRGLLDLNVWEFQQQLLRLGWAYLTPNLATDEVAEQPTRRTARKSVARPDRTTKAKPGRKMNLGVDLGVLSAGPKTGDIAEKLYCIVSAHRQKSERVAKVIGRLLSENPGLRAFNVFVESALQQAGFKTFSANQYSRIVHCFQPDSTGKPGRTARRSKAGDIAGSPKPPRRKKATKEIGASGLALSTEKKVSCLARSEGTQGEALEATLRRLLGEHPGPRNFCPFAKPTLERAGLRGFSPGEYQGVRGCYLAKEPVPPPAQKGSGLRIGGNYRQKAQALARHNGWEDSDGSVKGLMTQLRKASSNNATTFRSSLNDQADQANIERFSPEEADDLFRLGEAREPVTV